MRLSLVATLIVSMVPVLGLVACGEDAPAQVACTEDGQCASGQVCVGGVCGAVPCTANGDCESTQVCLLSLPEPLCGPAECGCLDEDACQPCPDGAMCVEGQCVEQPPETTVCTEDALCPEGMVCDGGVCVEGAVCASGDDCGEAEVCDEVLRLAVVPQLALCWLASARVYLSSDRSDCFAICFAKH